jgi:hypothetical protein
VSCAAVSALATVRPAAAAADGAAACPRQPRAVFERFISADCDACWTSTDTPAAPGDAWLLDWIVPSDRGDDAPLSAAAPIEAKERAVRAKGAMPPPQATVVRQTPIAPRGAARLSVASGPAWNGYFGVQFASRGRWPRGSTAWLALVETVPQGTDGTPVPRQLVRSVAGPITLDDGVRSHGQTRAMRWPETAKPERLRAVAWVESAHGVIVAFARGDCGAR